MFQTKAIIFARNLIEEQKKLGREGKIFDGEGGVVCWQRKIKLVQSEKDNTVSKKTILAGREEVRVV